MKNNFFKLLIFFMIIFTGCTEHGRKNQVIIRFGWWGSESRNKATLKAIDQFEKKYPNIKIQTEYTAWSGYNDKQIMQFNKNSAPDLMQVNWNMLFELGADKFMDLKETDIDLSNYPKSIIKRVTLNDKVVAVPLGIAGRVFYYQKKVYDKAGISIPNSFSDLFKAAKIFKEKLGKDYYPLSLEDSQSFYLVLYCIEQMTGKPFIKDKKVNYTIDELTKGFDFYLNLEKEGVIPTIKEIKEGGLFLKNNPKWKEGYYGGLYEWDTSASKIRDSLPKNSEILIGKAPADYGRSSIMNKISMTWAINAKTKHKKETELLLNYLLINPDGVSSLGLKRGIPLNFKTLKILEKKNMLNGIQYQGHKIVLEDAGFGLSPYFEDKELKTLYSNTMQELGIMINSREAAEKILIKTNKILDKKTK